MLKCTVLSPIYGTDRTQQYRSLFLIILSPWYNYGQSIKPLPRSPVRYGAGKKALFQVYKLSCPIVGKLNPQVAFKVFDSQILPILECGSEVWFDNKPIPEMEKFQLKFLKSTLSVRTQTRSDAVYAETGKIPLYIRNKIKALKYWVRILNLPEMNPVKNSYCTLKN